MAPTKDLLTAAPPPVRIPKLKYRNPLPAEEPSPLSPSFPIPGIEHRPTTSDSAAASFSSRASFDTDSLTSPSVASFTSSAPSSDDSMSSKSKKKTGSVFGFFSLREPSQVALEHYAAQQRRQLASKGPAVSSPIHGGSFTAKQLPKNVPKVNSKWDGVPDSAKKRHSTPKSSIEDYRMSFSRGALTAQPPRRPSHDSKMSAMTDGTCDPPNSLASPAPSVSNSAMRSRDLPLRNSPSTTTHPEMSYSFLDDSPTSPASLIDAPSGLPDSTPELSPTRDDSKSPKSSSPASSTDSINTIVRETAENIFKKLNDPTQRCAGDVLAIPVNETNFDHVPESHDFLFSSTTAQTTNNDSMVIPGPMPHRAPTRPIQNFSRPTPDSFATHVERPSTYRSTTSSSALPTLYEASLASTESLATMQDDSDAQSTIAPSELSMKWHESPRERLGLGGRLRMNDALPWDSHGNPIASHHRRRS